MKKILLLLLFLLAVGFGPRPAAAQDMFLGTIITTAFNFCPRGTLEADGRTLPISQNTALFSLLGTTYGGNGQTTFRLPLMKPGFAGGEQGGQATAAPLRYCIATQGIFPSRE